MNPHSVWIHSGYTVRYTASGFEDEHVFFAVSERGIPYSPEIAVADALQPGSRAARRRRDGPCACAGTCAGACRHGPRRGGAGCNCDGLVWFSPR